MNFGHLLLVGLMFSRLPPLNQIRGFEAAARLGSFKAAAEELNITPTAVSHQISGLEDRLGVLLFDRKTRAVSLTYEGVRFADVVHKALQQIADVAEEISASRSVLRVATTASFASMWLVPHLDRFRKDNPDIRVELITSEAVSDIRRDRRIDLAIRYGRDESRAEDSVKLITESFSAYANEDYLRNLADLNDADFIETRWKNRNFPPVNWKQWLNKAGSDFSEFRVTSFDQESHVIQAALAGQGIALVSSVLVKTPVQQGWLKPLPDGPSIPGFSYWMLLSPFSQHLRKVSVFRDWLVKELAECR